MKFVNKKSILLSLCSIDASLHQCYIKLNSLRVSHFDFFVKLSHNSSDAIKSD